MNTPFVSVVVAAAGQGKRMGAKVNKQFLKLKDKPILVHTLEQFEKSDDIDEIILVAHENEIKYCEEQIIKSYNISKVSKVIKGGKERQESIYGGINAVNTQCSIIMIHDGARPFINQEMILKSIENVLKYEAVGVGVPVKDTIKVVDQEGLIKDTPNRKFLWAIQTPQTFSYNLLKKAHERAIKDNFLGTDDTVLVERMNHSVKMILGSFDNIKITTKEDLYIGESILENRIREAKGCV